MSKAKFDAARKLIKEKNYEEAGRILATIDHPTAREWEKKLDKLNPPSKKIAQKRSQNQRVNKRQSGGCSRRFYGTLVVLIGLVVLAAISTNSPRNQETLRQGLQTPNSSSENANLPLEPSATITDTPQPIETPLSLATAIPQSQVTPIPVDIYYVMSEANARTCPDTQCDAMAQFPAGQLITVDGVIRGGTFKETNLWYRTQYNGQFVYVHTSLAVQNSVIAVPMQSQPLSPISQSTPATWDCTRDIYDCSSFSSRAEMDSYWNTCPGDPSNLDGNGDQQYCEQN